MSDSSSSGETRRIIAKSRHDDIELFAKNVSSHEEIERFKFEHDDPDTHFVIEGEEIVA